MAMISLKIVFICVILFSGERIGNSFKLGYIDVKDLLGVGQEIVIKTFEALDLMPYMDSMESINIPFIRKMEKELKSQILVASQKIDSFEQQMDIRLDNIVAKLLTDIPARERLDEKLRMIDQFVGQINDLYNVFDKYSKSPNKYAKYTLEDFARTCVSSRSDAVPDILKKIHRLFVPPSDEILSRSVLILLANQMQETASQICNENQSPQQLLYNLYTTVTLAEIKGYSMIQFSYHLLRLYNLGSNFTEEMAMVREQYATRTLETLRAVKTAMAFAPRHIWKCDARVPKLDETYTKLTQLFQGYIVNEVDLNAAGTCKESCGYYEYTKVYGCYKDQFCSTQRTCKGRLLKCGYIDSDMWVCPSPQNSDRRYQYIQYENGRVFGQKENCNTTKVDSWWRWLFWHCSYCFCYCDDNHANTDRYFSLRKVVSDVANNKVVTGVRFKKVNQIIHIQIQEGELMPRGSINETSLQWKPIEKFSVLDKDVKSGVDYHALSWEKRAMDLDDLVVDGNHILTGLKFRMVGSRLNLEARMATFNFTTGKLIDPLGKGFWISHDQTDRDELILENPDVPTNSPLLALPDSKEYQYLNFAPSDRNADAAQNTIPFIDIQPVEPKPPVPISGVGVYHKGRKNSGGYVALRLATYDFSQHLTVDLPPPTDAVVNTPNEINVV